MALNLPVFYQRTGSAIVFAAVMLVGLLWNNWSYFALISLISILCLRDYIRLMKKIDPAAYWPKWLPIMVQLFSLSILFFSIFIFMPILDFRQMAYIRFSILLIPAIVFIVSILQSKNAIPALAQSLMGLFYITAPMAALLYMFMHEHSAYLSIALILMIWTNDTMAYLVGSFIGKTPFSPISPKKTWEGTAGGAILTMIGAMIYGYFSHRFRMIDWAVLALFAGVAGTLGDLVESKLKRIADVKDSGTLMPGHGGALDRFDSLLLAAPFAAAYIATFMTDFTAEIMYQIK